MHPVLFTLGPLHFYSYGLMIALGFLAANFLATRRAAVVGIDPARIQSVTLTALIAGLAGGRLAYVLLQWELYRNNPLEILRLDHGGLVFFGGLAAGLAGGIWAIRRAGMPVLRTVDLLIPPLTVAHALGRIGCFLNGCCYGKVTSLPWGRHPTQLYEMLALLGIFFLLKRIERRNPRPTEAVPSSLPRKCRSAGAPRPGTVLLAYGLSYGVWRFLVEFLRGDNPPVAWGLTVFQLISLGVVAVSAALLAARRLRRA